MSDAPAPSVSNRHRRHPVRHWLLFVMRLILGCLFTAAAYGKIDEVYAFSLAIAKYQMLPENLCYYAALLVIWFEFICGVFLILGLWTRAANIVLSAMLFVFLGGIVWAMTQGLKIGDCGCGLPGFLEMSVGWMALWRDVVFLVFSLLLLYFGSWKLSLDLVVKVHRRVKGGLPGWRK